MAKQHKIAQHFKKENKLKLNVKLKPKLRRSQRLLKAKADTNPNLIQSQRWAKAMGLGIMGIDMAVGLHWYHLSVVIHIILSF